jgi:N-acetylmuramoyl-L-alanine amidase CwlA
MKTNLAARSNYGGKRALSDIKYIVIHYTGNDGDSDEGNGKYFANNIVKASAHYFVDDDSVTQSVPDDYTAWSVGGKKYADCNSTGGGSCWSKCTNSNSISVELCDTVKNGVSDFSEETVKNSIELVRELMARYGIDTAHVIRHFDVTGKICPKPYVDDYEKWIEFKSRLEECEMTEAEKAKMQAIDDSLTNLYTIVQGLADKHKVYSTVEEVPEWARPTVQRLINEGRLHGDGSGLNLSYDMLRMLVLVG